MERSDEYLLELALQGDGACFGELSRRWQYKIYGFICRYVGNSEEAEDLTQDNVYQGLSESRSTLQSVPLLLLAL